MSKEYLVKIHRGPLVESRFSPETGLATLTYAIGAHIVEKYVLDMQENLQAPLHGDIQGSGFRYGGSSCWCRRMYRLERIYDHTATDVQARRLKQQPMRESRVLRARRFQERRII